MPTKVPVFTIGDKTYKTVTGIEGEIRVVKPGNRVRLTWHKPGMKQPATLQIALLESGQKTSFRIHLEHLPSQKSREELKEHWRGVLDSLTKLVEE